MLEMLKRIYRTLPTENVSGLEIFSVGTFNGDRYTEKDLDEMVQAFDKVGFEPPVKAGHQDGQEDPAKAKMLFGEPALGYISRIYRNGTKLLADIKGIPQKFADLIRAGAYRRVSAEIYWNYASDESSGVKFPRVLKAISFLGADIPALTNLKAIESLYEKNAEGLVYSYDNGKEFRVYDSEVGTPFTLVQFATADEPMPKENMYEVQSQGNQHCIVEKTSGKTMSCYADRPTADSKCSEMNGGTMPEVKPNSKEVKPQGDIEMDEKTFQAERDKIQAELSAKLETQKLEMEKQFAAKQAELETKLAEFSSAKEREKELSDALAAAAERVAKLEQQSQDAEIAGWVKDMKAQKKLIPAEEERVFSLLKSVRGMPKVVKYSQDGKDVEQTPEEAVKAWVEMRKPHELFKEFSKNENEPDGKQYASASDEITERTKAYMNENEGVDFKTAMTKVFTEDKKSGGDLKARYLKEQN